MIEKHLASWEWQKLEADRAASLQKPYTSASELLYRGHADSTWRLQTTLERTVEDPVTLVGYYRLLCIAKVSIETFTDKNWDIPAYEDYGDWLANSERNWPTVRALMPSAYSSQWSGP